jgi:hypothetical protein
MLAGVLLLSIFTLTAAPAFSGNETWSTSLIWSLMHGHGYQPWPNHGSGAYDGITDYWSTRLGLLPSLLGELVFPTTLALNRAMILLTGFVALAVFCYAMRRLLGAELALIATAALAASWGFYAMSHLIRWDMMAILAMCGILALLVRGPPSTRSAAIVGVILGLGPDIANSIPAAMPGVLLLCVWEREQRWARIGALAGGVLTGLAAFVLLHFAPRFDFPQARDQFDLVYRPVGYGQFPLIEAIKNLSLEPLLNERDRYTAMMFLQWQSILIALTIAVFASGMTMVRALGVTSRWLGVAGLAGLFLLVAVTVLGGSPHTELRDAIGPMIVVAAGLASALGINALRHDRPYPTKLAPAILLIGLLVGWALYVGVRTPAYAPYALPFAVAAFACALTFLSPTRWDKTVPVVGLAVATIASSLYVVSDIRAVAPEAALDKQATERAQEIVPPGRTVIGEWVYWWMYKDARFQADTALWLLRWGHPDETFADTFHRLCPDYVLLDNIWLDRYEPQVIQAEGEFAPNLWPTDPREKGQLLSLLRREYEVAQRFDADGRTLTFWRRRAAACPGPGHARHRLPRRAGRAAS